MIKVIRQVEITCDACAVPAVVAPADGFDQVEDLVEIMHRDGWRFRRPAELSPRIIRKLGDLAELEVTCPAHRADAPARKPFVPTTI